MGNISTQMSYSYRVIHWEVMSVKRKEISTNESLHDKSYAINAHFPHIVCDVEFRLYMGLTGTLQTFNG